MVLFKSSQADVEVPEDVTTWQWLFESKEYYQMQADLNRPVGAYIDSETRESIDWVQTKSKSTALSSVLMREYGLGPGDTVTIFSSNTIWYPVCMFAVIRAGGRVNGASPAYTVDEMAYSLKIAKAKIVVTLPSAIDRALAAAKQVGIPAGHVLLIQGEADGFKSVQQLIQEGSDLPPQPPYAMPPGMSNKELCGYLNFSSGTTGLPKAVMISHHNVIAQCYLMRAIQIDPDKFHTLAVMPLFHITGTWRFIHYPIFLNGSSVMLSSFSMPLMLKAIVQFGIEELTLVPPILLRLARDPVVDQFDLRHVKRWSSGAAPISSKVLDSLKQRFPWIAFRQGYGATEASVMSSHAPGSYDWKYAESVGTLLPNTIAKVIDEKGNELGIGDTGEILAKGPQVAMGYLDNDEATKATFDGDGFYHTGDAGFFDEEGMLHIQDRIKEMIKVKGFQVPPAELEDLLLGHEDVDDCAIISQPDEYAGELPKAFVVLKNDIPIDDEAGRRLLDFVRKNKVRYKWLAEVEFIDKIPKSPAGKILRRVLKEKERARGTITDAAVRVRDRDRYGPLG